MDIHEILRTVFKDAPGYWDENGSFKKWFVHHQALCLDSEFLEKIYQNEVLKEKFFQRINGFIAFRQKEFLAYFEQKKYFTNSFTQYKNKIGLQTSNQTFLSQSQDICLVWPYKDCIFEGSQKALEETKQEFFFHEILAQKEITQLLEPKVFTAYKRYGTREESLGTHKDIFFQRDESINQKRGLALNTITDNLILKGNNLIALHSIKKEFAGKIKLIYIDPPYNTGKDSFHYNDRFTHSTWLTFMKNRLEVARELLKEDGVIFVQIDDHEHAYLKVLMDEIFGRENFITNFIWEKTQHFGRHKLNYYSNAEYLLCYAKSLYENGNIRQLLIEGYNYDMEDAPLYNSSNSEKVLTFYPEDCIVKIPDGIYEKTENKNFQLLTPAIIINGRLNKPIQIQFRSRWTNETLQKEIQKGCKVLFKTRDFSPRILYNQEKKSFVSPKQILFTNENNPYCTKFRGMKLGTTANGSSEIVKLFGKSVFSYPKPESLIAYIIDIATKPGDIVLDYHLGSGTTAAVAHKMGRQYIGIEQMDYIQSIVVPRLQKVIDGDVGGISPTVGWKGGGSFVYIELKKYNENFMEQIASAKDTQTLLQIWEQMKAKSFFHYTIDLQKFQDSILEFQKFDLTQQKEILCRLLDKNQLYVNLSSLDDFDFSCTLEEKQITCEFYQI